MGRLDGSGCITMYVCSTSEHGDCGLLLAATLEYPAVEYPGDGPAEVRGCVDVRPLTVSFPEQE